MSPAGLSVETWLIILIGLVTANIAFFSPKFCFSKICQINMSDGAY